MDIQSLFSGQPLSQCIRHSLLTFIGRQVQQFDVQSIGHFLRVSHTQIVPRHAKAAGRKHLFAVPIAGKCTGFSQQRVHNVTVIDRCQILAHQTRHCLDQMTAVRHRNGFGTDPQVDQFADQATGHGVCIRAHHDRAAGCDANTLHDVVGVQTLIRKASQMSRLFEVIFATTKVRFRHQVFNKSNIVFAAVEISTFTQQQSLIDAAFQMMIGSFDIAILIGTLRIRPFGFAVVVLHQRCMTFREFALCGVISDGRSQRIAALPQWGPVPAFVGFCSDSVITARYLPPGIGSNLAAGSTWFASKPLRLAMDQFSTFV
jgi:hypothetical protein